MRALFSFEADVLMHGRAHARPKAAGSEATPISEECVHGGVHAQPKAARSGATPLSEESMHAR